MPGQCQNRFTTVGTGGFTNKEGGPPSDTCGDLSGQATQSFTVKVLCQPDADGKVPVATTAYWAQSSNGATCNAYPSTAAKCANITAMAQVESVVGSITVNKIANSGSFGFEIAGGTVSDSSFDLAGGASKTVTATAAIAGTQYTITESKLPEGWELKSATCSGGAATEPTVGGVKVTLKPGTAHAVCNFTNDPPPAKSDVQLWKAYVPGDDSGSFLYELAGSTTGGASAGPGLKLTKTDVTEETEVIFGEAETEGSSELDHYTQQYHCTATSHEGESFAVQLSEVADKPTYRKFTMPAAGVSCTITNTRIQRLVKIDKRLDSEDGGRFDLLVNGTVIPGGSDVGDHTDETGLNAGVGTEVTVSERAGTATSLANYTSTLTCLDGDTKLVDNVPGTSGSFTMPAGDGPVVCTFTNERRPVPPAVAPIPTTSPEGLAALALMMVGVAGWAARRRGKRGK